MTPIRNIEMIPPAEGSNELWQSKYRGPVFLIAHCALDKFQHNTHRNAAQATVPAPDERAARIAFQRQYPRRFPVTVGIRGVSA